MSNLEDTSQITNSNLEDTSQITNSTPVKIKNPKRVEQGKKLAAISKAAKEKKAREKFEMEHVEESGINYGYVVGGVGILSTIGYLYFKKSPPAKIEEPAKSVKPVLESFD